MQRRQRQRDEGGTHRGTVSGQGKRLAGCLHACCQSLGSQLQRRAAASGCTGLCSVQCFASADGSRAAHPLLRPLARPEPRLGPPRPPPKLEPPREEPMLLLAEPKLLPPILPLLRAACAGLAAPRACAGGPISASQPAKQVLVWEHEPRQGQGKPGPRRGGPRPARPAISWPGAAIWAPQPAPAAPRCPPGGPAG